MAAADIPSKVQSNAPWLKPVEINDSTSTSAGDITNWEVSASDFSTPAGTNRAYGLAITTKSEQLKADPDDREVKGHFIAEKIWNAVWNDYADLQLLNDEYIPGKAYIDTLDGAKLCTQRCQMSVIGIASDTFAHAVGKRSDIKQLPIAVAGWVLAFVDKEYPCGTPLTNDENGNLTEMTLEEKRNYPERLIGIYKRKEMEEEFGPENSNKIKVNGRHWIKVK